MALAVTNTMGAKKERLTGVNEIQVLVTVQYSGDELNTGQQNQVAAAAAQAASAKVSELGGEVLSTDGVIREG